MTNSDCDSRRSSHKTTRHVPAVSSGAFSNSDGPGEISLSHPGAPPRMEAAGLEGNRAQRRLGQAATVFMLACITFAVVAIVLAVGIVESCAWAIGIFAFVNVLAGPVGNVAKREGIGA